MTTFIVDGPVLGYNNVHVCVYRKQPNSNFDLRDVLQGKFELQDTERMSVLEADENGGEVGFGGNFAILTLHPTPHFPRREGNSLIFKAEFLPVYPTEQAGLRETVFEEPVWVTAKFTWQPGQSATLILTA